MSIESIRYTSMDKQKIHKIEIEVEFKEPCTQLEALDEVRDKLSSLLFYGGAK